MKKLAILCLVGFSLFAMTACSSDNGTAHVETQTASKNAQKVVVDPKANLDNKGIAENIVDTKTTKISRYVDCEALVTIYTSDQGIAIIKNSDVNHELTKEKCK